MTVTKQAKLNKTTVIRKHKDGPKTAKYFTFSQNNSGGYFVQNNEEGVGEYIIVQAHDWEEATNRFRKIGENVAGFDNYCSCCGVRWGDCDWMDDDDATDQPELYGKNVYYLEMDPGYREKCYIHYLDGSIVRVDFRKKEDENA